MDLFEPVTDRHKNWLPDGGIVNYYGKILSEEVADSYFRTLLQTIRWQNEEVFLFGKKIITKRETAWYGEEGYAYTYSNRTKYALPWTEELLRLKDLVEKESGDTFNTCLLNLYHNGTEGMGWHSDDEPDLKKHEAIASLSLVAERRFFFRNKRSKDRVEIFLEHGSLLVMKGTTQTNWLHRLLPDKKVKRQRINLTFRTIITHKGYF